MVINVPDCRFHYQHGELQFSVSPVDAIEEIERLRNAEKLEGTPFLTAFSKWLVGNECPELARDVVDWLADHIIRQYAEVKKKRYELLNSPSSSEPESSG